MIKGREVSTKSDIIITNTGAPQGAVLPHFLFTVYTTKCQIEGQRNVQLIKFADDTCIQGLIKDNEYPFRESIACFEACNIQHIISNIQHTIRNIQNTISNIQHTIRNIQHIISKIQHTISNIQHIISNIHMFLYVCLEFYSDKKSTFAKVSRGKWDNDGAILLTRGCKQANQDFFRLQEVCTLTLKLCGLSVETVNHIEHRQDSLRIQKSSFEKYLLWVQKSSFEKYLLWVQKSSFGNCLLWVQKSSFEKYLLWIQQSSFGKCLLWLKKSSFGKCHSALGPEIFILEVPAFNPQK
ncbi:reverse transcriptase-like protein [Elysia marginata]|uniref:Reverse transcriptase-like protein n=1 Tax=Elysia marginata TaxID=1093978 RepID=A0AAV4F1H2_9GAST|nr:reverse transcriptase-like protein [Elysia marginata]